MVLLGYDNYINSDLIAVILTPDGSPAKKSNHPSGKPVPSASPALTVPHVITRNAVAIRATMRTPEVFRHLVDSVIIMNSPFYHPNRSSS